MRHLLLPPYRSAQRSYRVEYGYGKKAPASWISEVCFAGIIKADYVWLKGPVREMVKALSHPDVEEIDGHARVKMRHYAATNLFLCLLRLTFEYPEMCKDVLALNNRGFSIPSAYIICQLHETCNINHQYAVGYDAKWEPLTPDPWDLRYHYVINHQLFENNDCDEWSGNNKSYIERRVRALEKKAVKEPRQLIGIDWNKTYKEIIDEYGF